MDCNKCGYNLGNGCVLEDCMFTSRNTYNGVCKNSLCKHTLKANGKCSNPDCWYSKHYQDEEEKESFYD